MIGQNYAYGYPTWEEAMKVWHDEEKEYEFGLDDEDFYYSRLITHYTQVEKKTFVIIDPSKNFSFSMDLW